MGGRSALRYLAAAVGLLFLAGTVFQLLDQLNLVAQPPSVPDAANLVDRVTAYFPYRQSIWPIFLLANGLVGLAFLTLTGLGIALARRVARTDDRGTVLLWTLVTAGLLGGVAQVLLVGEVKATIDIPYCDCGFKNEEIVSQVWAEMLIQSAVQLVVQVAALFAAAGRRGRRQAVRWRGHAQRVGVAVVSRRGGRPCHRDPGRGRAGFAVRPRAVAHEPADGRAHPGLGAVACAALQRAGRDSRRGQRQIKDRLSASPAKQARATQPFASAASACWAGPRIPVTRRRSLADSVRQPRVVRLPSLA